MHFIGLLMVGKVNAVRVMVRKTPSSSLEVSLSKICLLCENSALKGMGCNSFI
uniref:Uncharacterized protein n=1 Tax=Ascaris lumbricoides TaxID=6252 RepID=A0A0M3ISL8_ASCLU